VHAGRILRIVGLLLTLCVFSPNSSAQLQERRVRDEESFLASPPGDLTYEFARIAPIQKRARFQAVLPPDGESVRDQSLRVDFSELIEVLTADGFDDADRQSSLAYSGVRQGIKRYAEQSLSPCASTADSAKPPVSAVPEGLPEEFALYLKGARAYATAKHDDARDCWLKLLELPPERRRHRSVWAAFMLGRCAPESVGKDWSIAWFERCRELAADKQFTDKLGLAAASYGWEAKLHFDAGDDAAAIDLYLSQLACGDVRAADSLAEVAETVFRAGGPRLAHTVHSPAAVGVLAVYVGCRGGPHRPAPPATAASTWLSSLGRSRPELRPIAPQIAWASYAVGSLNAARRWALDAPVASPRRQWVMSKVAVRTGSFNAAAEALTVAAREYRRRVGTDRWDTGTSLQQVDRHAWLSPADQCLLELGVVRLAQGFPRMALRNFIDCGYKDGVEFLAERVLTADELIAFVKSTAPSPSVDLKALLARRLVRLGRWDEAEAYLAPTELRHLKEYRESLRLGDEPGAYAEDRAAALWQAARLAHDYGHALFFRSSSGSACWRDDASWKKLSRSADEAARVGSSEREEMKPNYPTFVAGTLAWRAAELLPDEDDQTARILNTAGRWYSVSDGDRANRFYNALVRRCGTTKIGREADRRGWFAP
jgi:tetratricopeptide (TPR) repeat protein